MTMYSVEAPTDAIIRQKVDVGSFSVFEARCNACEERVSIGEAHTGPKRPIEPIDGYVSLGRHIRHVEVGRNRPLAKRSRGVEVNQFI